MATVPGVARTKEFDRDEALRAAIRQFADHGFEGTSTDMLLESMGISRQSLYDTFGDKQQLYLTALAAYSSDNVATTIRALHTASSPLKGIEAALQEFIARPPQQGCMGVGAVCEFGTTRAEIVTINEAAAKALLGAFERRLADALALGEIAADIDPQQAAQFLLTTLSGLRVAARGGASMKVLHANVAMALRSLR